MLNQSGVTITKATTPKSILWAPENAIALSCVVTNTGVTADAAGKKLLPAGTPVKGDLTARNTPFIKDVATPVGVMVHTVDVTSGKQNGSVLVSGVVDLNKLDTVTAALFTSAVQALLPRIIFVK